MHALVFVYGTLKQGYANFHVNLGTRKDGTFETVQKFQLYILGEYFIPWLIDQEGFGHNVQGQLFDVDEHAISKMDELEMLNVPGWFTRRRILVRSTLPGSKETHEAFVYFGDERQLISQTVHFGPVKKFSLAHDNEYKKRAA
jgi:gamma-glutamylaminecyclotransferase